MVEGRYGGGVVEAREGGRSGKGVRSVRPV